MCGPQANVCGPHILHIYLPSLSADKAGGEGAVGTAQLQPSAIQLVGGGGLQRGQELLLLVHDTRIPTHHLIGRQWTDGNIGAADPVGAAVRVAAAAAADLR